MARAIDKGWAERAVTGLTGPIAVWRMRAIFQPIRTIMTTRTCLEASRRFGLRSIVSTARLGFALAILTGLSLFSFPANAAGNKPNKADIKELVAKGAPIVDVRTPGEFKSGHLGGAINLPVNEVAHRISTVATNRSAALLVHCQSGVRSATAKKKLEAIGYTNVIDLGSIKRARELTGK